MWEMFNTVAGNAGVSFEDALLILILVGGVLFYVKDFKVGVIMHFLFTTLLTMFLYGFSLNYGKAIVCSFIFLVLLMFSIYPVSKTTDIGGLT